VPAVLIAAFQWGDWTHPLIVTVIFIADTKSGRHILRPANCWELRWAASNDGDCIDLCLGFNHWWDIGPLLAVPLTATVKVLLGRYVWGRRLREKIEDSVKSIPVVEEPEVATRP
jgi:hypothetical protein